MKKSISESTIKMYERLSYLEKTGQNHSEEYKALYEIIPNIRKIENSENPDHYELSEITQPDFKTLKENRELLKNLRIKNQIEYGSYTLEGNTFYENIIPFNQPKEKILNILKAIELSFFQEIYFALMREDITEEEKKTLIETKYALISISPYIEKIFCEGEASLRLTKTTMEQERYSMLSIVLQKVQGITDKILNLSDKDIENKNAISQVLYAKTLIELLPEEYKKEILLEIENEIALNELIGSLRNRPNIKINKMINKIIIKEERVNKNEYNKRCKRKIKNSSKNVQINS